MNKRLLSILLNIMFQESIGRFQLELINYFTYFPPSSHLTVVCFFPVGLSSLIWHFQQVLWVLKFLLSPTMPVENFVLTTKRLQERNTQLNSNCQLPKPGNRRNFNTHKTRWKCCINNERPTGKRQTNVRWDDGGK